MSIPRMFLRAALTAPFTIALPSWASETAPPPAKPTVEILSLDLHPSDRGTPQSWKKIGVDPFTGDVLKGGQVLMKDTAIRISEVQEAWQMRRRGECHSYSLKNGDKVRTTFGANKSLPAEIAFASSAGDPERRGDVCLVRSDGTAVVFLDGCGNISVAWAKVHKILPTPIPVAQPVPIVAAPAASAPIPTTTTPVAVVPGKPKEKICVVVPLGTTVRHTPPVATVTLNPLWASVCGRSTYVQGITTGTVYGGETRSTGYTLSCVEE